MGIKINMSRICETFVILALLFFLAGPRSIPAGNEETHRMFFATFASTAEELRHSLILARSIRAFGGASSDSPIFVYTTSESIDKENVMIDSLRLCRVEVIPTVLPARMPGLPYLSKVYAAAQCEEALADQTAVLVWMDEDTILLQEPSECALPGSILLGYRPVMHRNVGSTYSEPPNRFWQRIYELLRIPDSTIFSMRTVADQEVIRPYINAGLLVVRPNRGILRSWLRDVESLVHDSLLMSLVHEDGLKAIFLHQTALVGPLLRDLKQTESIELSHCYNYPLFFDRMFGAAAPFDSIDSAVTIRYDTYFRNPEPGWEKSIKGRNEKVEWIVSQMRQYEVH